MAKDSRPEDDKPRSRRRRRPQTLDLKAREIGAQEEARPESAADAPQEEQASPSAAGAKARDQKSWTQMRARAGDWRALLPVPVLTGALGVLAGALIVFFLMPRGGDQADPRVGQLAQEVATLSERIETLAARPLPVPAPDQSGLGERIDRLTAAIGEAEQRLAAVEKRPAPKAPDLSVVDRRTASIETTLQDLRAGLAELRSAAENAPQAASQVSIEKLSGRIGELETRIASLATARAAEPASDALAREVVALHALGSALRAGKPYQSELAAAREALGARAPKLAALDAYAAKGLPRVEVLEQQFRALVPALLRGPVASGNFFERLMSNAARLVEVRRAGEPEGMSLDAIVARAEAKLARRDLDGAIGEIESLPEDKRQIARDWLEAAKLRRDGEALVQTLAEEALARARESAKP